MQYHALDFDAALQCIASDAVFCAQFAAHPLARVPRYEAGFADTTATIDQIAGSLGGSLTASDRDRIFAETRRPAIEAFILNPAVGFELRDGFAAVYNQCGQLTPGQGAAAGVVGGLSGNVAALR